MILSYRISLMPFISLKKSPLTSSFLRDLIGSECWIFSDAFFVCIEIIIQLFFFSLLILWIILMNFWMLSHIVFLGQLYLVMMCYAFLCHCIWLTNTCKIICVHETCWTRVCFLVMFLSCFGLRIMPDS